jgi:hypothetical protein
MLKATLSIWLSAMVLAGQTTLSDVQVKPASKLKSGTLLPATCKVGDVFFKTDAVAGYNLFACATVNQWAVQSGAAALTVQANGVVVGTQATQNFQGGVGLINAITTAGSRFDISQNVDPAVVQTHALAQSGRDLFCKSTTASGQNFTCEMTPTLASYQEGMVIYWMPSGAVTGGAVTLSIDSLGAVAVTLRDGATAPSAEDLTAGQLVPLWYDGQRFRLLSAGTPAVHGSQPVCGAGLRGRIWFVGAGTGVKDTLAVCAKDDTDVYSWRTLY